MGSKSSKSASSARDSLSPAAPDAKVLRSPLSSAGDRRKQPNQGDPAKRVLFAPEHAQEASPPPPLPAPGLSLADICTASSTRRAEQLKQLEASDAAAERGDGLSRFAKYRNFFKNHDTELARAITRMVTRANKRELRAWVAENVGALEFLDEYGKLELVELAMVSAAIARHGEKALARMDAKGELSTLPNTALHTHDLRMASKQQACRAQSKAARKDEMQAAHYVGLEVMMTLNARLPIDARIGDELREILNDPSNLRLVLAATNQSLHKKADTLLMIDYEELEQEERDNQGKEDEPKKKRKVPRNKPTSQEYARLVQVAKHAQSDGFQAAMRAANGVELYRSLRDQFLRLDVGDRKVIWDVTKDTITSSKGAATKVVLKSEVVEKSKGNRRTTPSRSPSPAVDVPRAAKQSVPVPVRSITTKANATKKPSAAPQKPNYKPASKADEVSKLPKETQNPIVKLVKKIKDPKPAKEVGKPARKVRDPKLPKPSKENRPSQNTATVPAAKASTRRVTRSRGAAKHVALPDTFSDSSEFEDDSEYEDDSDE